MFSSLILTLMELGILHIGHVLDGVSREESNSALTKNPYLLKQTLKSKNEKRACVIWWSWVWRELEGVTVLRNKISVQCISFPGVEWFRPASSMNLCTMHWVCMKADFLQKLSSEAEEGKTECQSPEVICFITYQQLLQEVYCSGKDGFEANFWKDCGRFGKSTEIAGPLLYMNVLWASQKWFIKEVLYWNYTWILCMYLKVGLIL